MVMAIYIVSSAATRNTSSSVVWPSSALSMPVIRKVFIPSVTAWFLITAADARFIIRRRTDSVTVSASMIAAAPAVKNSFSLRFNSEPRENFRLGHKFFTAIWANLPHQTLRARHQNRARNQERLDPHVVQTRNRAGGVVGMQSRKHLVTGQRRFHRNIGGLVVANFTHHHDVGVLS